MISSVWSFNIFISGSNVYYMEKIKMKALLIFDMVTDLIKTTEKWLPLKCHKWYLVLTIRKRYNMIYVLCLFTQLYWPRRSQA